MRRFLALALLFCTLIQGMSLIANAPSSPPPTAINSFDTEITALAQQLAGGIFLSREMHIAVVGFANLAGKETDLGNTLAEEMTTRLFQTGKFTIVERQQIIKVLKEQKLELTGPIDPDSIKNLGRLLKVECIITGIFVNRPYDVRVFARLIDTMTGEIRSLAVVTLQKDALLLGLLGETAPVRTFEEASNEPSPFTEATRFPQYSVDYRNFLLQITRSYKDASGSAVFEILVTNKGRAKELTFGKTGWRSKDSLLGTSWGSTYTHPKIGIIGASRPPSTSVTHVFPEHSSISIIVSFADAGKNVHLCHSLALTVTGIERDGGERYITFTDLPTK